MTSRRYLGCKQTLNILLVILFKTKKGIQLKINWIPFIILFTTKLILPDNHTFWCHNPNAGLEHGLLLSE